MSKLKAFATAVGLVKVQPSIVPETVMQTNAGSVIVKPRQIESTSITVSVTLLMPGEFDESKGASLLKSIMDKLAEVELC